MTLKTFSEGLLDSDRSIELQIHLNIFWQGGLSEIASLVREDRLTICAINNGSDPEFEPSVIQPNSFGVHGQLTKGFPLQETYKYCEIHQGDRRVGIAVYPGEPYDFSKAIYFLKSDYYQNFIDE